MSNKEIVLSDKTTAIAAAIAGANLMAVEGGIVTPGEDLINNALQATGTSLTMANIMEAQDVRNQVVAGITAAVGNIAVDAFAKNPDVNELTFEGKFGKDDLKVTVERHREYPNPADKGGAKIQVFGQTTVGYRTNFGSELDKVRDTCKAMARAALAASS